MKVAVFGASGKTGSLVLSECVAQGWTVNALVGDAAKFGRRVGIEAIQGDARSPEVVSRVLGGAEAVLCCLGMRDISVPATDFSDSVKTIVGAMKEGRVKRIVAIGSARLLAPPSSGPAPGDDTPNPYANIAAEHQRNYETLRDSGLQWTLMCPIALKEDIPPGSGKYMYEDVPPGSEETGYADLAHTMVTLVAVAESHGKRVGIASYRYRLK